MAQSKILLIEDENDIRDIMEIQLKSQGHNVISIDNGTDALDIVQSEEFDLYIIDRMLPGTNGIDICKFLRSFKMTKAKPILMVTALTQPENVIEGLEAGADDYVNKPFEMNVLLARVKALLRRAEILDGNKQKTPDSIITIGPLKIDEEQCKAWAFEKELSLTVSELKLFLYLLKNSRKVLGRKELVSHIQGTDVHVTERTIDTHIFGLRKKLGDASSMIETIRGIGYRVNDNE
jgi:two-component system, OmpR family, phosphate regulon response regulator PhoB